MAARHRMMVAVAFALGASAFVPHFTSAAPADELVQMPDVENSAFRVVGKVNTDSVYIRSGPGATNKSYPVGRLTKGTEVTVVGKRYEWLKILPPPGSYSLVSKMNVNRRGDGKVGRVTQETPVRAGSTLTPNKFAVQTKLSPGQDVQIINDEDEYYQIVPPPGAYVYIDQQYVTPVRRLSASEAEPVKPAGGASDVAGNLEHSTKPTNAVEGSTGGGGETNTSRPTDTGVARGNDQENTPAQPGPTTRPGGEAPTASFQELEERYNDATLKPLLEQPVNELLAAYKSLAQGGALSPSQKRIADARVMALQARADARQRHEAFMKTQTELQQRQQALEAERQEIQDRIRKSDIAIYSAVGLLRVSSLQQGNTTLYRLTDPSGGRTIAYIRSNDARYGRLVNQFVGVRGDVANDGRLNQRVITPTDVENVDPKKVNATVVAQIVPPSMQPAAASTGGPTE